MSTAALADRRAGIDVVLTNLSIGIPTDQDFIGDRLLKPFPQVLSEVKFPKWGTEAFRIREDHVGDYSVPEKIDITLDTIGVEVDGHALAGQVSDRHQQESQQGPLKVDLAAEVLGVLVSNMDLAREKQQADLMQSSAVYGTNTEDLNGTGNRWDDAAVDPTDKLIDAIESTIPDGCGKRPNVLWMGQQVWAKLIQNPKLKNRIFGSTNSQPIPTAAQIASLIGVDSVLIGRALSKTAAGVNTKLWGKNAGLLWVPPTAGKRVPAFGYTVEQTVFGGASESVIRVRDEMMGASGGELIKRSSFYSAVTLLSGTGGAGYLFANAITP